MATTTGHEQIDLERCIAVARGEEPADLVISGGQLVNVFTAELQTTDVAVAGGRVVGLGEYEGRTRLDATGLFVAPGYIDAHIHLESTMLVPREVARAVVPMGTTAVIADPHEIANVLGLDGINYMLRATRNLPLSVFFMLPSCVPATDFETSGARLDAHDLASIMHHPRVLGLAEVMNYPGVLARDSELLDKLRLAAGKSIDGHAPGLTGKDLNAYAGSGIRSDHECTTVEEALEKLRIGMQVFIREGSVAKNLQELIAVVTPENAHRCGIVSDDRHPIDLVEEGHVDFLLRRAIACGVPPLTAIGMVTIVPATHFRLDDLGAVAPGYRADLVLIEDLNQCRPRVVLKGGQVVAQDGVLTTDLPPSHPVSRSTMNVGSCSESAFQIPALQKIGKLIELLPGQLVTGKAIVELSIRGGFAVADPERDIAKLAVVERHNATGNIGLGFVRGFELQEGALGTSVAHDSHNIVVVGTNDADMFAVVRAVEQMGGGLAAAQDGKILGTLPLPVAGLMSEEPVTAVAAAMRHLLGAARHLGSRVQNPFMMLSFLALPVIPALRLTDRGLVDVEAFRFVNLFDEG